MSDDERRAGAFIKTYDDEHGRTQIFDLDGVSWHDAPIPERRHKCSTQTKGYINYFTSVYRCACGAISKDGRRWDERNSRGSSALTTDEPPSGLIDRIKREVSRVFGVSERSD